MRIGIHGKKIIGEHRSLVDDVFAALHRYAPQLRVSSAFLRNRPLSDPSRHSFTSFEPGDDLSDLDVFISLGGDGTLLESIAYIGRNETPVLGINMGSMGFLATTGRSEIEQAIACLFAGDYKTDSRTMLTLVSQTSLFGSLNFALNEFAVLKEQTASMINVHVYVDQQLLNSYWADGVIVATPTGSTGYSLSCGGPLIYPSAANFVITPVSPHNLTARPIVVSDKVHITLSARGRHKKMLVSLDSRFALVDNSVALSVRKSRHCAHLIQLPDRCYFKTLRQKLNWGLDVRN